MQLNLRVMSDRKPSGLAKPIGLHEEIAGSLDLRAVLTRRSKSL